MAQAKKRKKFFEVELPLVKRQLHLMAYDPSEIENRIIKYDLTRMLKGKNTILHAITKKEGENIIAKPYKIELIHSAMTRMVRKGTNYIEDSFSTECNGAQIRIKPFLVSRRKIHRSVRNALRKKAREEIISMVKNKTADELFEEIIRNQIQKPLSLILKKIYPLSSCEIRVFEIEKRLEEKPTKTSELTKEGKPTEKTEANLTPKEESETKEKTERTVKNTIKKETKKSAEKKTSEKEKAEEESTK